VWQVSGWRTVDVSVKRLLRLPCAGLVAVVEVMLYYSDVRYRERHKNCASACLGVIVDASSG
jgi:hypothetical protein